MTKVSHIWSKFLEKYLEMGVYMWVCGWWDSSGVRFQYIFDFQTFFYLSFNKFLLNEDIFWVPFSFIAWQLTSLGNSSANDDGSVLISWRFQSFCSTRSEFHLPEKFSFTFLKISITPAPLSIFSTPSLNFYLKFCFIYDSSLCIFYFCFSLSSFKMLSTSIANSATLNVLQILKCCSAFWILWMKQRETKTLWISLNIYKFH